MLLIAYFSTATDPQTAETIDGILVASRANNARDDITGLLVAGGNRFLQIIEGPRAPMKTLWAAIRADHRHCGVTQLVRRRTTKRRFDAWSMAFRSELLLSKSATFPQTLKFLVRQVEDPDLRRQIELVGRSFIRPAAGVEPTPWEGQPSIAAISEALPPAAVVSMQVTRSVAKRAT